MKKLLIALTVFAFVGGTSVATANTILDVETTVLVDGDDKDKKKKKKKKKAKKGEAAAAGCSSTPSSSCCSKAKNPS